jgi:intergrase/recombinase
VKDRLRYAQKYSYCLLNRDFSELNSFSECKRHHILEGLSALAKFLGVYEVFKELMKAYGLKWRTSNPEDLIIARMSKVGKYGEVLEWINEINTKLPKFRDFMTFIAVSGLRFVEAVNSYNLIIDLAKRGKLSNYYNFEKEVLEHYHFKQLFIRRTKKALISFAPRSLIERISKNDNLTPAQINNRIRRAKLKSRFGDVREYFATFMTKFLNPAEIDFLQGRVSASVFMRNYFNPALVGDLRERVFAGIGKMPLIEVEE